MTGYTKGPSDGRRTLHDLPSHKLLQRSLVVAAGCDVDEWDSGRITPPDDPCTNHALVYGPPHRYSPLSDPPDDPSKTVTDLLLEYLEE